MVENEGWVVFLSLNNSEKKAKQNQYVMLMAMIIINHKNDDKKILKDKFEESDSYYVWSNDYLIIRNLQNIFIITKHLSNWNR